MERAFEYLVSWYGTYGYPVLFFGVFLENAGLPVPGETAVLAASFLASPAGGEQFKLLWVMGLTCVAAILGDNMGYWIGRELARPRLFRGKRFLFLTPERVKGAEDRFQRHGAWVIFTARFVTGLRVVAAPTAGVLAMPWPRFLLANSTGAVLWATTISLLGYFFGRSWELVHHWLSRGAWLALGAFVLLVFTFYVWRKITHPPKRPEHRP